MSVEMRGCTGPCDTEKPLTAFRARTSRGRTYYPSACDLCERTAWNARRRAATAARPPAAAEVPRETSIRPLPRSGAEESAWVAAALCRGSNLDWWRSPDDQPTSARNRAALAVCASCPSRQPCRDLADEMEADVPASAPSLYIAGIWGGELPRDRIRRRAAA